MAAASNKIGLLGGSFDPVHNGHLAIARSFLNSSSISELWVMLSPHPPHKRGQLKASYEHRHSMLQETFASFENLEITDIEKKLPSPSYTVQTLSYLRDKHPDKSFYLCIGSDSAQEFTQWYQWQKILSFCDLLVASRPSKEAEELNDKVAKKAHFIEHQPVAVSSTDIRNRISAGDSISDLVPQSVEKIISQHNLYSQQ